MLLLDSICAFVISSSFLLFTWEAFSRCRLSPPAHYASHSGMCLSQSDIMRLSSSASLCSGLWQHLPLMPLAHSLSIAPLVNAMLPPTYVLVTEKMSTNETKGKHSKRMRSFVLSTRKLFSPSTLENKVYISPPKCQ